MARRKPRGSSKAGRPKKEGVERNASGRIVQRIEPNAKVMLIRQICLGDCQADPSVADDPMLLAHARGWLTQRQVEAGNRFAAYYRASHEQRRQGGLHEAPDVSGRETRSFSQIPSAEICDMFDRMMDTTSRRAASEESQINARRQYNFLACSMTEREQWQVFRSFCLGGWDNAPLWLTWMIVGRSQTTQSLIEKGHLTTGLDILDGLLTQRGTRHIVEMKTSARCA